MSERKWNFNPGPAVLPVPALEKAQAAMLDYNGCGMGIMEISHRGKDFEAILAATKDRLAKLLGLPADRKILFMQGGANLQFSLLPMNLLPASGFADYVITGTWAKKAHEAAALVGKANAILSTKGKDGLFRRVPRPEEIKVTPGAAYLHLCSNNTIYGTQYHDWPETGEVPLIVDMSSDIASRVLDMGRFDMIYAGAQKNLGPSGVIIVIMSDRLLERCGDLLPPMMNYKLFQKEDSLYNTPPTFSIYLVGLVLEWIEAQGGLAAVEKVNVAKGKVLYGLMDEDPEFWKGTVDKDSRSLMNIPIRLPSEELEKKFFAGAEAAGFVGLKGHRSVGGIRVSMYNAMPLVGIEALVSFMRKFRSAA
jgi:phosphoserine aminotransferase